MNYGSLVVIQSTFLVCLLSTHKFLSQRQYGSASTYLAPVFNLNDSTSVRGFQANGKRFFKCEFCKLSMNKDCSQIILIFFIFFLFVLKIMFCFV